MIIRFSTHSGALTMHGDAAVRLLRAMGHSGSVPGAILAADLPAALERLRIALATHVDEPPPDKDAWQDADDDPERRPPPISLRTRAVPLVDMVGTAIAQDSDLMWERG